MEKFPQVVFMYHAPELTPQRIRQLASSMDDAPFQPDVILVAPKGRGVAQTVSDYFTHLGHGNVRIAESAALNNDLVYEIDASSGVNPALHLLVQQDEKRVLIIGENPDVLSKAVAQLTGRDSNWRRSEAVLVQEETRRPYSLERFAKNRWHHQVPVA